MADLDSHICRRGADKFILSYDFILELVEDNLLIIELTLT